MFQLTRPKSVIKSSLIRWKKTLKFRSTKYHEKLYELAHAITQDYFLNTHTILLPKHLLYSDQFFYQITSFYTGIK